MQIGRDPAVGSVALLALTALVVWFQSSATPWFGSSPPRGVPHASGASGTVAVELTGDSGRNGVYFVPKGTTVAALLDLAGIRRKAAGMSLSAPAELNRASTVNILQGPARIEHRPMAAAKRIALGIPIDVNRSSREELVLVPGIGEATAERILERRAIAGSFRRLDDLMLIRGIKEKRLETLRPYLCVGC